jgi:hypothetical protein
MPEAAKPCRRRRPIRRGPGAGRGRRSRQRRFLRGEAATVMSPRSASFRPARWAVSMSTRRSEKVTVSPARTRSTKQVFGRRDGGLAVSSRRRSSSGLSVVISMRIDRTTRMDFWCHANVKVGASFARICSSLPISEMSAPWWAATSIKSLINTFPRNNMSILSFRYCGLDRKRVVLL